VVYLYLDRLSNAFADWGRSGNADQERRAREQGPVKQAAE
jgi:hydrophobic/amphiphilic exporter-1 (mainly G- bacteria), HAE1 family